MKKTVTAVIVTALAFSVLGLSGCKDTTKQFNAYVGQVNKRVQNFSSMETSIQAAATSLNSIALNPKGAQKALGITKSIKDQLAAEKAELGAAIAILAKVKALDVKPEMKKYADLQTKYFEAQIAVVDEEVKLFDEMDRTYKAVRDKTGTTKSIEKSQATMTELRANILKMTQDAAAAQKAAQDYFNASVATK